MIALSMMTILDCEKIAIFVYQNNTSSKNKKNKDQLIKLSQIWTTISAFTQLQKKMNS